MKPYLIFLGLLLLITACNSTQQDERIAEDVEGHIKSDAENSVVSTEAIWSFDYNQQTEDFEIKQLRTIDNDDLTGETLEKIINKSWPEVQIEFIKTSNDTAFISIPDSKVLTQQMGSAGAESFMISTTFSFTELKGINKVSFAFEEGDHAVPGVYYRNSWDKNRN